MMTDKDIADSIIANAEAQVADYNNETFTRDEVKHMLRLAEMRGFSRGSSCALATVKQSLLAADKGLLQ
jgi:hypothetical protein